MSAWVGIGARLWIVGRGRSWRVSEDCVGVDCGGEVGLCACLWIVSMRFDLAQGCGLWGRDDGNAAL